MLRRFVIDLSPLRDSRPFRFIFAARLISLLGIGLLMVALPVQVYQLTGSSLHVAGVSVVTALAMFVGSLSGGVLADRHDRRRTIQLARSLAGLGFVILGVNSLLDHPALSVIYGAAVLDGVAGGVSGSALMALTPALVGRHRLAAAGALMTLTTELGTVVTPGLAGVIIAATGGVSVTYFVAAGATALTVTLFQEVGAHPPTGTVHEPPLRALLTGLRFAVTHRVIRGTLLVGLAVMLVSGPMVLLPAYADQVLGAGAAVLGLLYGAPAAGALVGLFTSGWTGGVHRNGRALLVSVALLPVALIVVGAGGTTILALLGLAGFGLGRAVNDTFRFAVLQQHTPDDLRGRVSSLWLVQAVSGTAVGSLVAGVLGNYFAADTALLVYGCGAAIFGVLLCAALRPVWSATAIADQPAGDRRG
ncbi:ENTS family enterobactin (siderophore) exporter [Nocardia tenerifensis]|uniref:ENTS family enterobactin (Siderophore) exporter n=2 Tax=Nocardia tenerifensis TaxID=228006 RepID=A0A318K9D1_9NOCA|nr:enterobactin transporter EntS [Nocardia tenerifensis]PXX69334.1 ENTS family enterobactin (siderophore) exporter [Nocardia tenerifensis]